MSVYTAAPRYVEGEGSDNAVESARLPLAPSLPFRRRVSVLHSKGAAASSHSPHAQHAQHRRVYRCAGVPHALSPREPPQPLSRMDSESSLFGKTNRRLLKQQALEAVRQRLGELAVHHSGGAQDTTSQPYRRAVHRARARQRLHRHWRTG